MTETNLSLEAALARVKLPLALTWAGLWLERITRAFWPVWTILLGLFAALAFGLQDILPLWADWAGLAACGLGVVWSLIAGGMRFRRPGHDEVLDRLDARLPGRPLAALRDHQAIGAADGESVAVWRTHIERMTERAAQARPVAPDLRLSARDPLALRYVTLIAAILALLFGNVGRVIGVQDLAPGPGAALAAGPAWEGWIQPPAYTGKPSLYLNDITRDGFSLPVGSHVILRLYGKQGALKVTQDLSAPAPTEPETKPTGPASTDPSAPAQNFDIARSGTLAIEGPGGRSWKITVIPDGTPSVKFLGTATRRASGEMHQRFAAHDDYGVTTGRARISLDTGALDRRYGLAVKPEKRDPIVLDLPMPISGDRTKFDETLIENLSKDAWANLPVEMTLSVEDAAGHITTTAPHQMVLPGRRFFEPLAAAVIEMRRDLLWSRANGKRTAQILRAITNKPEGFIRNESAYLLLRITLRRLERANEEGLTKEVRDEIAESLWQVAVQIEDGDLSNALERLRRAQDRLSEAIRNGASKDEIASLMDELNKALRDYMRQLAQQQQNNPDKQSAENQQSLKITGDQLQQMLDRLQQLMEQGRMAEAQQLLDQLSRMMENMRVAQGQNGMPIPGQQQMQGLADTLRQQQGLSDRAFRNLQNQGQGQGQQPGEGDMGMGERPDQPGQGMQPGQGQQGQGGDAQALADRQRALRDQLRRQAQQGLPGAGTPEGKAGREALDRAGRAMDRAEQALRNNDMAGALDRQAEAMDALREGMRNLGRAMARNDPQQGQQGGNSDQAMGGQGRDPLGRQTGETGRMGTDRSLLQGEDIYRRAQELLKELRRRSGDQSRPEVERDYLKRLLEPF
ncbi:TIGR02302 family protein [Acidimangrovimonas pyrenivorans]|uniref:TIGR02302 family protein n=1 Tax=Acidimangrovimonas pyrenivorans TaxID=2030798 RepID=A0ABV7AH32_9RHOB